MLESVLRSEPAETKLLLGLLSGSVITVGALVVCWLAGSNPAGVADVSTSTNACLISTCLIPSVVQVAHNKELDCQQSEQVWVPCRWRSSIIGKHACSRDWPRAGGSHSCALCSSMDTGSQEGLPCPGGHAQCRVRPAGAIV